MTVRTTSTSRYSTASAAVASSPSWRFLTTRPRKRLPGWSGNAVSTVPITMRSRAGNRAPTAHGLGECSGDHMPRYNVDSAQQVVSRPNVAAYVSSWNENGLRSVLRGPFLLVAGTVCDFRT